jgi:aspartyl aminopeptidase
VTDAVADLLAFINRSPTPYHAVAESVRRLEAAGFVSLSGTDIWRVSPGDRFYLVRGDGSLITFEMGSESPVCGGFRIIGAHSDSPNLRLKPRPDVSKEGYRQLGVAPYGGLLLHTWLDRDLSIAGRVSISSDSGPRTVLIAFDRPLVRIPSLAIHLSPELKTEGLKLNPQQHSVPIAGLADAPEFVEFLASELREQAIANVQPQEILAFDLMLHDAQPAAVSGARGDFIYAPRLDNLASCHAALTALIGVAGLPTPRFTRVVVLYDHEEIGSRTAQGAASPFLVETLERSIAACEEDQPQGLSRALERSTLISADVAHAVNPNYADKYEPGHRPVIGGGPVIKVNANQTYVGDADTLGLFASLCARVGVTPQHFVNRSDLPCGSTIGPISAARTGIRTVDVGNPVLSMHSCREMAGSADVDPMIAVLRAYFDGE